MALGFKAVVEWRAGRIPDPIERLRYLRRATAPRRGRPGWRRVGTWSPLALAVIFFLPATTNSKSSTARELTPPTPAALNWRAAGVKDEIPKVWLVEQRPGYEVYSNGLRVENSHATAGLRRTFYEVFRHNSDQTEWRSAPAGIVFHTTESDLAPFEPNQNKNLQRIGKDLLAYVRRNHCYHFLIDRFGRVFRVVDDSDQANHAGMSIWADDEWAYVNLNSSFLGVAFEAQTQPGEQTPTASQAQIHAGRVLTEMLRSKYRIPAANCVTHAQVSVNPSNRQIGYHTDWAASFPFVAMGLRDNYEALLPSLYEFGFEYDAAFMKSTGARLWRGLLLAEEQVRQQAMARGLEVPKYRAILQLRYRLIVAALKARSAVEENTNETD